MFFEVKSNVLKEKATIFPKVQTVPNQVFTTKGLNKNHTAELTSMVEEDNKDGYDDFFQSAPLGNAEDTDGLSEMTC